MGKEGLTVVLEELAKKLAPIRVRAIVGLLSYAVTEDGRVFSFPRKGSHKGTREIQAYIANRHLAVQPSVHSKSCFRLVHRLVLEAFVGPCPKGMECRHLDGNPRNNRLENLRWGTHKENVEDSVRQGVYPWGERSVMARLTEVQIREIRKKRERGARVVDLTHEYQISRATVYNIVNGETWRRTK